MDSLRAEEDETMGLLEQIKEEFGEVEFEVKELEQARQILLKVANQISRVKWGIPSPLTGIANALSRIKAAEAKLK